MRCPVCGGPMYRVVNEKGTAHAICSRCSQYVECATCTKTNHPIICPACYVKPAPELSGKPHLDDADEY